MKRSHVIPWGLSVALLLLTGCSQTPDSAVESLDPKAPAAAGLPAAPGPDEPAPLENRAPFGLYAASPTPDTLARLAQGSLSPDQRFRASLTQQGAWVARVDGAWLWQIELPSATPAQEPTAADTAAKKADSSKPSAATPAAPAQPPAVSALEWASRDALLLRDTNGMWWRATPDWAAVSPLPAALQGKEELHFSPDGSRVLYYTSGSNGRQLWVAAADGSGAKLLGVNVTGNWSDSGEPVVEKLPATTPPAATTDGAAAEPGSTKTGP